MIIKLEEVEIHEALKEYVSNQGLDIRGKEVKITLTAGRKANGYSAEVDIVSVSEEPATPSMDPADPYTQAIEFTFNED